MTSSVRDFNRVRSGRQPYLQTSPHRAHDLLRSGIRTGLFSGDMSLVEDVLVRSLSTSRNAVRQALQMLAAEGLVDRRPNRGTMVIRDLSTVSYDELVPANAFRKPRAVVTERDHRQIPATLYLRTRLGSDLEEVDMCEILISVDREPRSLRVSYIPNDGAPIERITDVVPIPVAFRTLFGVDLGAVEASISAVAAGGSTSRLLGIPEGSPVLVEEVLLRDCDGVPRELSYTHHRADRVSLSVLHRLDSTDDGAGPDGTATAATAGVSEQQAC